MELKNAAELLVCSLLSEALPDLSFFASKTQATPKPPLAVVAIDKASKILPREETWSLSGQVTWITRADATTASDHANNFKRIYDTLAQVGNGYDIATKLVVHGLAIFETEEFVDGARQAHGDRVFFNMGVSER